MRFEGIFIDDKGRKVNWWFEAPSEEALLKHLQENGWKVVSMKKVLKKEELISEADVYRGLWVLARSFWTTLKFIIGFPIAFILVTLDWLGKRERERTSGYREALKEVERILKEDHGKVR